MTKGAVLFDLDGTLLDTAADFRTALNRLLNDEGEPPLALERIRAMVSNGSANLVAQAFQISADHPRFEGLRQRLLDYYRESMLEHTRPFPGLPESLALIEAHQRPWGIVTNKPTSFSKAIIQGLALNPQVLICPEDTGKPKPHPGGILLACQRLGADPATSLYIGDHLRDIDAGKAAGCLTMAAAYGYLDAGENPHDWGADWIAHHPEELPDLLRSYLA